MVARSFLHGCVSRMVKSCGYKPGVSPFWRGAVVSGKAESRDVRSGFFFRFLRYEAIKMWK
jgi:hypothetical protein